MITAPVPVILRRIAAGTAEPSDLEWLRDRLASYLDDPKRGLERALWLDRAPGEPPWWQAERRRERDGLILRLWRERYPALSAWDAAERIAVVHRRYVGGQWLRDRASDTPPADPTAALLWGALRLGLRFPTSRRRIFEIINDADRDALY